MGPYEVIFYEKQDGTRPVEEFLDSIDGKLAAKIVSDMRILAASGPATREPHSKELEDGIFELRSKQGSIFPGCCISSMLAEKSFSQMALSRKR